MRTLKEIDHYDVRSASASVGREEYELGDTREPGLSLRVRKSAATWALRGRLGPKQSTWKIGAAGTVGIKAARERAAEARKLLARGIDPARWLAEQEHGGPILRTFDPNQDGWLWEQGRDAFLEFVREHRAPATYGDYRRTLLSADLKLWEGRPLKGIDTKDVRRVQETVWARGKLVQAHHTLRIVKSCMGWLAQRSDSGIAASPAEPVAPIDPGKLAKAGVGRSGKVPTPEQIGDLGWTLAASTGPASARYAGALALLSAQRIATVLQAGKDEFTPCEHGGIWTAPPAHTKGKRGHVIPLPPVAWHVVRSAMAAAHDGTPLLFPQTKRRRVGDEGGGHLSYGAVRDALGTVVAPHDIRRAFGTHGEDLLGFGISDIKAILDHAEGASGDVTRQHYALSDGQHFKWRLMRAWEAWVLAQVAQRAGKERALPPFMTP
jgi:integrase